MTSLPQAFGASPLRWAFRLWLAVAVAVAVRTLVFPDHHTIFPVLAGGAAHWWADQPLYADYKPLDYFRYPPVFAVVFTPLYALGPRIGGVLWSWLGIGVFILGLRRFLRDVVPDQWTPAREAVFLALGALGALRGLWNAQSNALAVGLVLLGAAALLRRAWWPAAAVLAASVFVKLTPVPLVLLLCVLQPRRLPPRLALFLALGLLAPFLTRPPMAVLAQYRDWFGQMAELGGERWPGFRDAWTVWLVLRQWGSGLEGMPALREPIDSAVYRCVQLLTAAAVLAWCLWQRRAQRRPAPADDAGPGDGRGVDDAVRPGDGVRHLRLSGPDAELGRAAARRRRGPLPDRDGVCAGGFAGMGRRRAAPGGNGPGAADGPADRHDAVHALAYRTCPGGPLARRPGRMEGVRRVGAWTREPVAA